MALLTHKVLRKLVRRLSNRIQSQEQDIEDLRDRLKTWIKKSLKSTNKVIELTNRNETQSVRIIKLMDELTQAKTDLHRQVRAKTERF